MEFVFGNPEDIQKHLEHHQMSQEDLLHRRQAFFNSLDEEQLIVLRYCLSLCDGEAAAYMSGIVTEMMNFKFSVCPCGVKHDEELAKMIESKEKENEE